ncbi:MULTISPECIES: SDR family oxidoreductase [unclassified Paenibacillus]|uniref:dTDP-4-dehydrorhamnose reductase family protein n=1 Tax=unclassified Paenibacillus TaxID=185978 RepID=UPI0024076CC1|nr:MULTISPECIES: SDR family oxidoreductase [unclassified Paenibacillus]MDF9844984.1 dTDP-4-dehydrorhamnose reductase [Paenibacillus sp. PastF-2]MDF9851583.1 dTDP-4-dehydrorhamnose reductase [Paenibacillus sp. PastM-2]MDF9858167.1 dTDP-4-dehydrorhamnose reductase [Paenibacillus sp. PastF-1]MDH6483393.1 dTDP-4-dehydrorhamnose reductase [Paenibacillus sp. PastH-2]MDH6510843.1 dTDP-4-dehydrorhamnose reductase [Paenibacillus sp. PastM-3]
MKLLIFGGNGMAGHMLVDFFRAQSGMEVFYTTRDPRDKKGLILDAADGHIVEKTVELVRPDIIINAIGVLNQFAEQDIIRAYHINGFLPHRLRYAADHIGARLIHISTDCVFEGTRGGYSESDHPDGTSTYALTKTFGEVNAPGHLTIRTSIIGPEIRPGGIGLLNWFMRQQGNVTGYRNVLWNGVTTLELAKAVRVLMLSPLSGIVHLAHPKPVSKNELLILFKDTWGLHQIEVVASDTPVQNRTLLSTRTDMDYTVPDYPQMMKELSEWMNRG